MVRAEMGIIVNSTRSAWSGVLSQRTLTPVFCMLVEWYYGKRCEFRLFWKLNPPGLCMAHHRCVIFLPGAGIFNTCAVTTWRLWFAYDIV